VRRKESYKKGRRLRVIFLDKRRRGKRKGKSSIASKKNAQEDLRNLHFKSSHPSLRKHKGVERVSKKLDRGKEYENEWMKEREGTLPFTLRSGRMERGARLFLESELGVRLLRKREEKTGR